MDASKMRLLKKRIKKTKSDTNDDAKEQGDNESHQRREPVQAAAVVDVRKDNPSSRTLEEVEAFMAERTRVSTDTKRVVTSCIWTCNDCDKECFPIRGQSWCLCGHRYNMHNLKTSTSGKQSFPCKNQKCPCVHFYYIASQGSWFLRCSCKHKHTDHDAKAKKHPCKKPACANKCKEFMSPWVCNCNHPWSAHTQSIVDRVPLTLEDMIQKAEDLSNMVSRGDST